MAKMTVSVALSARCCLAMPLAMVALGAGDADSAGVGPGRRGRHRGHGKRSWRATAEARASARPPVVASTKAIHRLSNVEYDNTIRDLLNTDPGLGKAFVSEEAEGFDNIATALSMSPRQVEDYFTAARQMSATVFADATLRGRIVTCDPAAIRPALRRSLRPSAGAPTGGRSTPTRQRPARQVPGGADARRRRDGRAPARRAHHARVPAVPLSHRVRPRT